MPSPRRRAVSCWLPIFFFLNSDTYGHLERINLRRIPALPREARTVSTAQNAPQTIVPVPYETTI
jgi:hypothetical protein